MNYRKELECRFNHEFICRYSNKELFKMSVVDLLDQWEEFCEEQWKLNSVHRAELMGISTCFIEQYPDGTPMDEIIKEWEFERDC